MCTDGENMWPSNFGLIFCCKNLKTAVPGNRFHQKEHKQLVILSVCLCMNQDWSVIICLPSLHAKVYDNIQIAGKNSNVCTQEHCWISACTKLLLWSFSEILCKRKMPNELALHLDIVQSVWELGNCLLRWRWWRSSPQWKNWSTLLSHCSSWLLSILCYALGRNHGGSDVFEYFCTADPCRFIFCMNVKAFAFVFCCTCRLFGKKINYTRFQNQTFFYAEYRYVLNSSMK